jgi:hypothetical protein
MNSAGLPAIHSFSLNKVASGSVRFPIRDWCWRTLGLDRTTNFRETDACLPGDQENFPVFVGNGWDILRWL